mmetsp:Transcript_55465/g.119739  ORF Transcript_55465/g.119739 Transcript_55465/m.119739 type:complete len:273 (+) Transcript_55465:2-820(+)
MKQGQPGILGSMSESALRASPVRRMSTMPVATEQRLWLRRPSSPFKDPKPPEEKLTIADCAWKPESSSVLPVDLLSRSQPTLAFPTPREALALVGSCYQQGTLGGSPSRGEAADEGLRSCYVQCLENLSNIRLAVSASSSAQSAAPQPAATRQGSPVPGTGASKEAKAETRVQGKPDAPLMDPGGGHQVPSGQRQTLQNKSPVPSRFSKGPPVPSGSPCRRTASQSAFLGPAQAVATPFVPPQAPPSGSLCPVPRLDLRKVQQRGQKNRAAP